MNKCRPDFKMEEATSFSLRMLLSDRVQGLAGVMPSPLGDQVLPVCAQEARGGSGCFPHSAPGQGAEGALGV